MWEGEIKRKIYQREIRNLWYKDKGWIKGENDSNSLDEDGGVGIFKIRLHTSDDYVKQWEILASHPIFLWINLKSKVLGISYPCRLHTCGTILLFLYMRIPYEVDILKEFIKYLTCYEIYPFLDYPDVGIWKQVETLHSPDVGSFHFLLLSLFPRNIFSFLHPLASASLPVPVFFQLSQSSDVWLCIKVIS